MEKKMALRAWGRWPEWLLGAAVWIVAGLALPGGANASGKASGYVLRLAHVTSDKEPIQQAMVYFADRVKARSNGRIEIIIFPNAQLGTNPEVFEQVRAGAPIITIADPGYLGDFVADFGVLGGPYLIEDPRQFSKIVSSDLYRDMSARLRKKANIALLALNWLFGSRNLIADKPVSKPADIAGMTVRVPPNIMWARTFQAMGARPVQLPWSEVYSGLSSGVVDAAESPLPSIYAAKLYEVKKTVSLTRHFIGFTGLIVNAELFDSLAKDLQAILREESLAAGVFMTELMLNSEAEWTAKLEAEGVTINRDVDVAAFRNLTACVYDAFPNWTPGLYRRIRAILDH